MKICCRVARMLCQPGRTPNCDASQQACDPASADPTWAYLLPTTILQLPYGLFFATVWTGVVGSSPPLLIPGVLFVADLPELRELPSTPTRLSCRLCFDMKCCSDVLRDGTGSRSRPLLLLHPPDVCHSDLVRLLRVFVVCLAVLAVLESDTVHIHMLCICDLLLQHPSSVLA